MVLRQTPAGTHGARTPPNWLVKILTPVMTWMHRRSNGTFRGRPLLYLTTTGAHSGQRRTNPVARFDDGQRGWIIVASYGGAARHPAWYHNLVAHPDQVWAEVSGVRRQVIVEQLEGAERERAWDMIVHISPSFLGYSVKTDRTLPVLRLRPTDPPPGP
jgi:deazaflavin-dependent oxidoreductase (nitroreductase family)